MSVVFKALVLWRIAGVGVSVPCTGDTGLQNISDHVCAVFANCMKSYSDLFP